MKCIIYGGGGFIGSHLADGLCREGNEVTIFDKQNFKRDNILHITDKINIIEGDFANEIDIKNSIEGQEIIFHLVSTTLPSSSNQNEIYDVESNLISSLHLLREAVSHNIKKIIFISSGGTVYGIPTVTPIPETFAGNPLCSYGIIKKTIEEYIYMYNNLYGIEYTIFRLSNPYGERQNPFVPQGAIAVFLKKIIMNEPIEIWGDGNIVRDYIYISDVINAILKSRENSDCKGLFNIGYGEGHTLNDILKILKDVTKKDFKVKYTAARNIDVPNNVLDISKAKKTLGWSPQISLEEGIRMTYKYFLEKLK